MFGIVCYTDIYLVKRTTLARSSLPNCSSCCKFDSFRYGGRTIVHLTSYGWDLGRGFEQANQEWQFLAKCDVVVCFGSLSY